MRRVVMGSLLAIVACADLPGAVEGVCGNGALDAGEACDTFVGAGQRCRAADEESSCRYDCVESACPAGLGCGVDGLCRAASNGFLDPEAVVPFGVARLAPGDLDADGRDEVIVREVRGDLDVAVPVVAQREGSTWTTSSLGAPAIAFDVLVEDGSAPRIAMAVTGGASTVVAGGIQVFRGGDEPLLPVLTPTFALEATAVTIVPLRSPSGDAIVVAERDGRLDFAPSSRVDGGGAIASVPGTLTGASLGTIATNGACDAITIGTPQGIASLQPCEASGWAEGAEPVTLVTWDDGRGAPALVHVNDDDVLDWVVLTERGLWVAFGVGDGKFGSTPGEPDGVASLEPLDVSTPATVVTAEWLGVVPCARGATGCLFLIATSQILRASWDSERATFSLGPAISRATGAWSSFAAYDANGDGLTDVVLTSDGRDLDFLLQNERGGFNSFAVSATAPAASVLAGDIDGDLVVDLVVKTRSLTGSNVEIALGGATRPGPRTEVAARFASEVEVQASRILGTDDVADVVVVAPAAEPGALEAYILVPSTTRALLAPSTLATSAGISIPFSVGVLSGVGGDRVVAVALPPPSVQASESDPVASSVELWAGPLGPDGVLGALSPLGDLGFVPGLRDARGSLTLPVALLSGRFAGGDAEDAAIVGTDGSKALFYVLDGESAGAAQLVPLVDGDLPPMRAIDGVSLDGDGDGDDDIALWSDGPEGSSAHWLWNDPDGWRVRALDEADVAGLASCSLVRGGEASLFLASPRGVVACSVTAERETRCEPVQVGRVPLRLGCGDVDGDGLTDILASDSEGVFALLRREAAP